MNGKLRKAINANAMLKGKKTEFLRRKIKKKYSMQNNKVTALELKSLKTYFDKLDVPLLATADRENFGRLLGHYCVKIQRGNVNY